MSQFMRTPEEILSASFGYSSFRPGQKELVNALLAGKDVLGIMPTGAGKSICYQVPALAFDGLTLVISPLVSLMKDQVFALISNGVRAAYLNSSLTFGQYKKALSNCRQGIYKIIYVAPERLMTPGFLDFAKNANISLVAVDEAHCVSQWGQNFRPSYLEIPRFLDELPKRPRLAAYTATATAQVREDIIRLLGLNDPYVLTTGYDRPNLYFAVEKPKDKMKAALHFIRKHAGQCGIVYCQTRKQVEEVTEALQKEGIDARGYHAGMDNEERTASQEAFTKGEVDVIVATNAFGMGIDKPDVRYVLHYAMPKSLENYYQEAGRAGRDGDPADCLLLFAPKDLEIARFLIEQGEQNESLSLQEHEKVLMRERIRLKAMENYCKTTLCLRKTILNYFGQQDDVPCSGCSNCSSAWKEQDVTCQAVLALHLIKSLPRPYGQSMIRDLLLGRNGSRIRSNRLNEVSGYASLSKEGQAFVDELLLLLEQKNLIVRSDDQYRTISVPWDLDLEKVRQNKVMMRVRNHEHLVAQKPKSQNADHLSDSDQALFDRLRKLRFVLAAKAGMPTYIIFSDRTLRQMAASRPQNEAAMQLISGVGPVKMEKYGHQFLQVIAEFLEENEQDDDHKDTED